MAPPPIISDAARKAQVQIMSGAGMVLQVVRDMKLKAVQRTREAAKREGG